MISDRPPQKKGEMHTLTKNIPPLLCGPSPHPQLFVEGVFHFIQLLHLGNEVLRRWKFIRGTNLRFTITWGQRSRQGWGSYCHHVFKDTTRHDPCLHDLKGLCKVTDIFGKLPGRINLLPTQGISLNSRNQYEIVQSQM